MIDSTIYKDACEAIGLPAPRWIIDGQPRWSDALTTEEQTTANLLWAAAYADDTSQAISKLRDHLGSGSDEWAAIVALRNEQDRVRLTPAYVEKLFVRFLDFIFDNCSVLDYQGNKLLVVDTTKLSDLKALRNDLKS